MPLPAHDNGPPLPLRYNWLLPDPTVAPDLIQGSGLVAAQFVANFMLKRSSAAPATGSAIHSIVLGRFCVDKPSSNSRLAGRISLATLCARSLIPSARPQAKLQGNPAALDINTADSAALFTFRRRRRRHSIINAIHRLPAPSNTIGFCGGGGPLMLFAAPALCAFLVQFNLPVRPACTIKFQLCAHNGSGPDLVARLATGFARARHKGASPKNSSRWPLRQWPRRSRLLIVKTGAYFEGDKLVVSSFTSHTRIFPANRFIGL